MFKQTPVTHCCVVLGQYFLICDSGLFWSITRERFNTSKGFAVFAHCTRAESILGLTQLSGVNWRSSRGGTFFLIRDLKYAASAFD